MKKYLLNENLTIKDMDKVIFNYDTAELIKFNDTGFDLLKKILNEEIKNNNLNKTEKEFIEKLIKQKIILEKEV